MGSKLTAKQAMFCKEYLIDLNATQAAIRAGYSKKTAAEMGFENLRKPHLQKEIQRLMNKRSAKIEIEADDILESILRTRNLCEQYLLIETEYGMKLDNTALNGITKNNELLGKHKKLFTDKVEHSGKIDQTVVIEISEDDD
jgi:phage terminase small subunit